MEPCASPTVICEKPRCPVMLSFHSCSGKASVTELETQYYILDVTKSRLMVAGRSNNLTAPLRVRKMASNCEETLLFQKTP